MDRGQLARRILAAATLIALIGAAVTSSWPWRPTVTCAQEGCGCPPNSCCTPAGGVFCCNTGGPPGGGGGGGGSTPQPTPPGGPPPGGTPPPGSTPPPGGTPAPTPRPAPTPTPYHGLPGAYIWVNCVPDAACGSGYANYLYYVLVPPGPADYPVLILKVCAAASACQPATPPPPPPPQTWPCDEPPQVSGGVIVQPCEHWPGFFIQAQVVIPPAQARVNPWPRSLNGLRTLFVATAPTRVEQFSDSRAIPCDGIDYNTEYTSDTFTCSNGTQVTEGGRVNWRIGVAWQRWTRGAGAVFGQAPGDEFTWVIPDRAWNGGEKVYTSGPNEPLQYTFETSSWGLPQNGPLWNPECQERDCSCDERVQSYTGMEAYQVRLQTWWWPEWTLNFDQYVCARQEWSDCFCRPEGEPVGIPHQSCGNKPPSCTGWWGQVETCQAWKWENKTDATVLGFGCDAPGAVGGWCKYDLRRLGLQPLVGWNGVQTAGANPDGSLCGSYHDYGGIVPVPVIEIQPVKYP